jgi:hypothetical protein
MPLALFHPHIDFRLGNRAEIDKVIFIKHLSLLCFIIFCVRLHSQSIEPLSRVKKSIASTSTHISPYFFIRNRSELAAREERQREQVVFTFPRARVGNNEIYGCDEKFISMRSVRT